MNPPRLPKGEKKERNLTVLFTPSELERLERAAAFYNLPKSVMAHDLMMKGLVEGNFEAIDDAALVQAEERQQTWRERLGLE